MPKIYRFNDFVLSDEVYTIPDEDHDEQLQHKKRSDNEDDESDGGFSETFFDDDRHEAFGDPADFAVDEKQAREIIQKAKEEAALIVNQANLQAKLDHDRLLAQTTTELEEIKKQAYEEAFQQGMVDGARQQADQILQCIKAIEDGISHLEGEQAGFVAEYEYNLKWLAWEIASKVLGHKIEQDETEMLSLVKAAVSSVKNADWIAVEVSDKMTTLIDRLNEELKRVGEGSIEVRGVSAPNDTCVIDTPSGMIDASVYSQLENLRIYFAQED